MEAKTIDEYLSLRAQGIDRISFDTSNCELTEFVMADLQDDQIRLLSDYGINTDGGKYYYTLNSSFPFGRHKSNNLKCVYKCDPTYIEWCLINADSFCIEEKTLSILEKTKPWISADLTFIDNGEEYILDVSKLKTDSYGFPYSETIRETSFNFSSLAKEKNKEKLQQRLNVYTVLRGSNWENVNPVSFNGKTKKIKIISK
jgi:hypothetical protein